MAEAGFIAGTIGFPVFRLGLHQRFHHVGQRAAGAREGETIVQLAPDQVHVPFGFRVVKITPSILPLECWAKSMTGA